MVACRVFVNPRRSMQRAGLLKHLLWRASLSSTSDIAKLGNDLIRAASQKVTTQINQPLQEYINKAITSSLYPNLKIIAKKLSDERTERPEISIEIQDFYLADPILPSRRGRLVADDWNRYPYLALDLGMLKQGTYSLLVRGLSFLSLVSREEQVALRPSASLFETKTNPYILTTPQKIILLFSYVHGDGDLLKHLYPHILQSSEVITDKEAGDFLPDIYRKVAKETRSRVRTGDDILRIQNLLETATKIEAVKRNPNPGGKNPREHAITIRLEPFVDLTLLAKPDPFAYRYQITQSTRAFFEPLIKCESIYDFLHAGFFKATNEALAINAKHKVTRETLTYIQRAHDTLKSPLGYSPITEICLLAGIYSITEIGSYFEIADCEGLLKVIQKENPRLVRFSVDRSGKAAFVKFNGKLTDAKTSELR